MEKDQSSKEICHLFCSRILNHLYLREGNILIKPVNGFSIKDFHLEINKDRVYSRSTDRKPNLIRVTFEPSKKGNFHYSVEPKL